MGKFRKICFAYWMQFRKENKQAAILLNETANDILGQCGFLGF